MTSCLHAGLAIIGSLALATSLFLKKRAGWCALAGLGVLAPLVLRDVDPVLALGALALVAARFARIKKASQTGKASEETPKTGSPGLDP